MIRCVRCLRWYLYVRRLSRALALSPGSADSLLGAIRKAEMKETRLKRGKHTHLKALKRGKTLTQALTRQLRRKSPKCEALGPKIQNPSLQNPIRTSQKAVMASKIP